MYWPNNFSSLSRIKFYSRNTAKVSKNRSNMSIYHHIAYLCLVMTLMWTMARADTPVRHCVDISQPLPLMVQIDECSEMPCDMWKGLESNIAIQFVATRNAMTQLTARVQMTSLGVTIPYDLETERSNVCNNLMHGAYCPLDAGEDVTYKLLLPVADSQPEVPTRLRVTLHDAANEDEVVACFLADTRVRRS